MKDLAEQIAGQLIEIGAVKLNPSDYFTWASGWHSPIYCDNRLILSYPEVRKEVRDAFVVKIKELYPEAEGIAGVATGGIAHGALVAEALGLPFVYIRSSAKGHGLENLIEGEIVKGRKMVIIEDLISTGGSSLKAFKAMKQAGFDVQGMLAIFTYGFDVAAENFNREGCRFDTLSNYAALLNLNLKKGLIDEDTFALLNDWRQDPANWKKD